MKRAGDSAHASAAERSDDRVEQRVQHADLVLRREPSVHDREMSPAEYDVVELLEQQARDDGAALGIVERLINERVQLRQQLVSPWFGVVHRMSSPSSSVARERPSDVVLPRDRSSNELPLLLTVDQTAGLLGVGRTCVYSLLASGDLRAVRIGRSRRIARADVVQFVERLRASA
jgi:excisionase family DNA binding protein